MSRRSIGRALPFSVTLIISVGRATATRRGRGAARLGRTRAGILRLRLRLRLRVVAVVVVDEVFARARGVALGSVGGEDETGGVGARDGDDGGADGENGLGDGVEQFGVHDSEEKRAAWARRARAMIGHRNRARARASGGVRHEGRGTEWLFEKATSDSL